MLKKYFTTLFAILFLSQTTVYSVTYTTVMDGDWGDPTTWGGVYPSSFFPTPVAGSNWFTAGNGDIVEINHNVTMTHNIFVRDSDIVIINTTGSLNAGGIASNSSFYNLSLGQTTYQIDGHEAGVYILGNCNVSYFRSSSASYFGPTSITTIDSSAGGSGNFDNFSDIFNYGTINLVGGDFNHNSGDLWMFEDSKIDIQLGAFNNRNVIRSFTNSCIISTGNFNNLVGGTVLSSSGLVTSSTGNIDNSANSISNWSGTAYWCASIGTGINVPPAMENCAISCGVSLPLAFLSLEAKRQSDYSVLLEWNVQSEKNILHYEVQNSSSGENFETIGSVFSVQNIDEAHSYSFSDESSQNKTYYRIKSIDTDGTENYSEIVLVEANLELSIYPNPFQEKINLTFSKNNSGTISITTIQGKTVYKKTFKNQDNLEVNTELLRSGSYILKINSENSQITKLLMK